MGRRRLGTMVLVAGALLLGACEAAGPEGDAASVGAGPTPAPTVDAASAASSTVAGLLRDEPQFSEFADLADGTPTRIGGQPSWLEVWDWPSEQFGSGTGVTVFVPTNAAFAAMDASVREALSSGTLDEDARYRLLGHHFMSAAHAIDDLTPGLQNLWTGSLELALDPLALGDAAIVQPDVQVANGYVHVIDAVLVPADVRDAADGDT